MIGMKPEEESETSFRSLTHGDDHAEQSFGHSFYLLLDFQLSSLGVIEHCIARSSLDFPVLARSRTLLASYTVYLRFELSSGKE